MTTFTIRDVDRSVVERALAELADEGVTIVPDVLTRDEADAALEALWRASDESQRRGVPAHIRRRKCRRVRCLVHVLRYAPVGDLLRRNRR